MLRYEATPYRLYEGAGGEIIHFDVESLNLTELSPVHRQLLQEFSTPRTREEVLSQYEHNLEASGVVDDLVELKLVSDKPAPLYQRITDLPAKVKAFRIVLTEQCNLRCAECFVTKNRGRLRTMTPETLECVIRQTVKYGSNNQILYHFFGGEPLIRFDHIRRAVGIVEEAVTNGKMIRPLYTITTNLTLLDEEIIGFFERHGFRVGVSIDGPKNINDSLRVYRDGRGTFEDVSHNYRRLIARGVDTHVLITPHPNHLYALPAIFRSILEQFPMKTITVNTPLHFRTVQWTVPGEKYAAVLIRLIRIAREFNVSVDSAATSPLAALAGNIKREGPCALVGDRTMVSIGTDGKVSFCTQLWHLQFMVADVDSARQMTIPIRRAARCSSCEARHICGGPCPAYQQLFGGQLDDNRCAFMRALLFEVTANLDLFEDLSKT